MGRGGRRAGTSATSSEGRGRGPPDDGRGTLCSEPLRLADSALLVPADDRDTRPLHPGAGAVRRGGIEARTRRLSAARAGRWSEQRTCGRLQGPPRPGSPGIGASGGERARGERPALAGRVLAQPEGRGAVRSHLPRPPRAHRPTATQGIDDAVTAVHWRGRWRPISSLAAPLVQTAPSTNAIADRSGRLPGPPGSTTASSREPSSEVPPGPGAWRGGDHAGRHGPGPTRSRAPRVGGSATTWAGIRQR